MKADKKEIAAIIATNRFGMGARPGEIALAKDNPREWLINALAPITPPPEAPNALSMLKLWDQFKLQKATEKDKTSTLNNKKEMGSANNINPILLLKTNSGLIIKRSIESNKSINYRLLDFFSNHFSVSITGGQMRFLAPTLDWDAIAPNLTSSFSKMLVAVISHPAMLLYLNNDKSIGPNSQKSKRRPQLGLNENLAREIFELHTMGVHSGYTQTDVIELAKAITGWSFVKQNDKNYIKSQAYIYRKKSSEPGVRKILNKLYTDNRTSNEQAVSILTDLANHPKTAQHICTKLVRHFVKDAPDTLLVNQMTRTWLKTNGNLKAVMETLISSNLAWQTESLKYKSSREFLISTYRAVTKKSVLRENKHLFHDLTLLGQEPYSSGSPAGFGDIRSSWDGPNELFNRVEWVSHFSSRLKKPNAYKYLKTALGNSISHNTINIIEQAESQRQAVSLLFMSPEFLVR